MTHKGHPSQGDHQEIAESLSHVERAALPCIESGGSSVPELVRQTKLQEIEVLRALQWLSNKGLITVTEQISEQATLGANGEKYRTEGLPERRLLKALTDGPSSMAEAAALGGLDKDEINICLGILRQKAAVSIDKKGSEIILTITPQGSKLLGKEMLEEQFLSKKFPVDIKTLQPEEQYAFDQLKKRREIIHVDIIKHRSAQLTELGRQVTHHKSTKQLTETLTTQMLKGGSWKDKSFRRYDVGSAVPAISGGRRHFERQAIDYIKRIWLDLGFKEMTGSLVQTAFWDLDALFVPQDHPARAMQDTFYIADPQKGTIPSDLSKRIKAVHETGAGTGSKGWGGTWSAEESSRNLLRTHTTVLSARTIAAMKQSDLPAKFFSVGKVFRCEAMDWSHLFEFFQVEGIVVDEEANLKHLKGYLREFYRKMGYPDVRMRPGHFPYTEPSVEVDVLHPVKNVWVELGGAGIFRPEVVKPLLGKEVPVLAWGQGLGRIISEYFAITDIRDIYKNDLQQLRTIKSWMR